MTAGRRQLSFQDFDQIMPDVESLMQGHETVGQWSLGQICWHLATVMRRVVDLPASTPQDPSAWIGEDKKRDVLESGRIPESMPAPSQITPIEATDLHEQAESLRQAIGHYRASSGPVIPHRIFGPLSKVEWDRLQLIHAAHHLSFAIPKNPEFAPINQSHQEQPNT